MQLQYKIISSPGNLDALIRDFIVANDHDFYPTIASRRDLSDFVQSVYQAKGRYVICFDGEKIVGLTSVYLDHPSFITYYHYIAIDKNYRGHGISTKLYNYVHEICKEHGVQWAIVKTWSTNLVSQAMFKKHGFFHLYTIEDDRSKGVHTYFYAKSFSTDPFINPVRSIAIIGKENGYALGNFARTISSMPRTYFKTNGALPFFVINNCADDVVSVGLGGSASHVLFLDDKLSFSEQGSKIECIHLSNITKILVQQRKIKWLLVGDIDGISNEYSAINNVRLPSEKTQARISELITEIRTGMVSPSYHKIEIATMAASGGYEGIVLGSPELHTMFNFDKMFNSVEIFDPWLELAILIQNNRLNFKLN